MAVITISKEYGTESQKVAAGLADKLGYEYIGKRLLTKVAKELNISESEADAFRKTASSKILRYVDKYTCSIVQKVVDREHGCLDDSNYYDVTKKLVDDLYADGDIIILGWGGQCILKGKPKTLHVRLRKDAAAKIETVMANQKVDESAAAKLIESEEKDMEAYIKHYFDADWNDASLYDLVIDMGKTPVEKAVEMICDNLKHKTS